MWWGPLLVAAFGVFTIWAAASDQDWFMRHPKASLFVALFGRTGARAFYILLGGTLVVVGALVALGVLGPRA